MGHGQSHEVDCTAVASSFPFLNIPWDNCCMNYDGSDLPEDQYKTVGTAKYFIGCVSSRAIVKLDFRNYPGNGQGLPDISGLQYIQHLTVRDSGFTGTIPASYAARTTLQSIDVSGNPMSGEIPESLANMPNLKTINVGNNQNIFLSNALVQKCISSAISSDSCQFSQQVQAWAAQQSQQPQPSA